jgi:hypothetical protein
MQIFRLQAASVYTLGSLDAATATLTGLLSQPSATFTDLLKERVPIFRWVAAAMYTLGSLTSQPLRCQLAPGTSATFTDNVTVLNEACTTVVTEDMLCVP